MKFNEAYFEGMILKETSKQRRKSTLAKLADEEWEAMTEEEKKHAIEKADKSPFDN